MEKLDISTLTHNADVLKKHFKLVGDSYITVLRTTVIFPGRYVNKSLVDISTDVKVLGIIAILDDNKNYAVINIPAYITMSPQVISDISIDGIPYIKMEFEPNDLFITNRNVVKTEDFIYDVMDEFFIQGKIPWYLNYEHVSNIFLKAGKYAGSKVGNNPLTSEILTSIIARDRSDKTVAYRGILTDKKFLETNKPGYVGLANIFHTFNNTTSKLVGSHYSMGIVSAIIDPEKEVTTVEEMLRS